ncbi:MAG: SUMF1/EgtB/PvdO family nonheme iron enzyme [Polyangiaceae bacterium]
MKVARSIHSLQALLASAGLWLSPASAYAEATMVHVAAGSFTRGHDHGARRDETPAQRVHLSSFEIDATLVTRSAFAGFVQRTGYVTSAERRGFGMAAREGMDDWAWQRVPHGSFRWPFLGDVDGDNQAFLRDDAPVVMVSYEDAVAFCAERSARLPTEAEWEFAMRAGSDGTRYPWGNQPERADGKLGLNFWQGASHRRNLRLDGFVYVSPVRAFEPNALGIYDAVGNVWQWTADFYAPDTYARLGKEVRDPQGPVEGTQRVLRGGSWWCGVCTCEGNGLHYRGKAAPTAAFNNNGFRCARSI